MAKKQSSFRRLHLDDEKLTPLSHSDLKMLLKIHKTITINRLLNKLGGVMYLKILKVWNFRKYGSSEEIDLNKPNLCLHLKKGLNVLIGENDSGKTAIIDAIKLVLKTHSFEWIKVDENDFYKNTDRLRIELVFDDMEKEAHHFNEWVEYHRDGDRIHPSLTLSYEVYKKNGRIIQSDINAGSYNQGKALKAEAKEYLKTTYLKPLRDANFDLTPKQNSRLSQILKTHAAFNNKDKNHRLLDLFIEFNTNVSLYFEGKDSQGNIIPDDSKGKELKDKIEGFARNFIDESISTNFEVTPANIKSILEKLALKIQDGINPGLGTLNKLFMAAELLHLEESDWSGLKLCLIEELEAHLHPQAQMKVIESLQKHNDIQILITSHSPNLTSKVHLENLILCHSGNVFPLGKEYTKLDVENGDYLYLERFLDVTKSNLFFAKGILMVEGWSEEILLPAIAKLLKKQGVITKDFTDAGIAVVNVASAEFIRFSKIFIRNKEPLIPIPVAIITDVDVRAFERKVINEDKEDKAKKNEYDYIKIDEKIIEEESTRKVIEKENEFNSQNVRVFVTKHWTLEYSLLKSPILGEYSKQVLCDMHKNINKDDIEKELAIKLFNKSLCKTDFAYKLAQIIDPSSEKHDHRIVLQEDDRYISSLIEGVKYVCN